MSGVHATAFITHETASGLDTNLQTHPSSALPLVWFGIFRERHSIETAGEIDQPDYWQAPTVQSCLPRAAFARRR
jgi:hypothetical protein